MSDMAGDLELRQMRYFLAVAESENLTRAAERCGVSQPAITQQIHVLEATLGVQLLARIGKRVRLTQAGEAFAERARGVLRRVDEVRDSMAALASGQAGHVEVGVIPSVHMAWVPGALARLSVTHPGVTVHVQERPSHQIETEVEAGRCEVGLGIMSQASPHLAYEALSEGPLCVVVPRTHALAAKASAVAADLDGVRVSLHPQGYDMRQIADVWYASAGRRPHLAYELSTIESLLAAARVAGTPTMLPAVALTGRAAEDLVAVPLVDPVRTIAFGTITVRGSQPSPAAAAFLAALQSFPQAQ
jgi:LysR family cyn operon transcriptional activator